MNSTPIQVENIAGRLGHDQVTDVHRIECCPSNPTAATESASDDPAIPVSV